MGRYGRGRGCKGQSVGAEVVGAEVVGAEVVGANYIFTRGRALSTMGRSIFLKRDQRGRRGRGQGRRGPSGSGPMWQGPNGSGKSSRDRVVGAEVSCYSMESSSRAVPHKRCSPANLSWFGGF